jgi:hypothetical protein
MSLDIFRHIIGKSNLTKVDRLVVVYLCPPKLYHSVTYLEDFID